jgi:hypothetical protein
MVNATVECTCQQCGKQMWVIPSRIKKGEGKYCSLKCSGAARTAMYPPVVVSCANCGEEFTVERHRVKPQTKLFCSRACHHDYASKKTPHTCKTCGKQFMANPKRHRQWCSVSCREHPLKGQSALVECVYCGKQFRVHNSLLSVSKGKYCSATCYRKHSIGENHPLWKGSGPYCELFNDETKVRARHAFRYKCVLCGMDESDHVRMTGKRLSVHHIFYDKSNGCGVVENRMQLVPLCYICHAKTNGSREMYAQFLGSIIDAEWMGQKCFCDPALLKVPFRKHKVAEHTYLGKAFKYKTEYY